MPKTLQLPLKKKWFDMIKAGIKKEEYRKTNRYWSARFTSYKNLPKGGAMLQFKSFDKIVFTLGYPKATDKKRRVEFKNPQIRFGQGRPEWGAQPDKLYFVITWEN